MTVIMYDSVLRFLNAATSASSTLKFQPTLFELLLITH